MYRDAKEELKRLEEALLEEDDQSEEIAEWDVDMEDAISDIPDLPEKDNKDKKIFGLTVAVIALSAAVVGLLIFLFVRYRGLL